MDLDPLGKLLVEQEKERRLAVVPIPHKLQEKLVKHRVTVEELSFPRPCRALM
eukprot:m.11664 g.11664  ORF g.11664 m.11664 type:complete len:53 (-) comp4466_c0_seq2:1437-1595(-)